MGTLIDLAEAREARSHSPQVHLQRVTEACGLAPHLRPTAYFFAQQFTPMPRRWERLRRALSVDCDWLTPTVLRGP